jgi:hypothetical protein
VAVTVTVTEPPSGTGTELPTGKLKFTVTESALTGRPGLATVSSCGLVTNLQVNFFKFAAATQPD